jgi:hypothetical protein
MALEGGRFMLKNERIILLTELKAGPSRKIDEQLDEGPDISGAR